MTKRFTKKRVRVAADQVGRGVGRELGILGSATLREACGVTGILPMNSTRNCGKWRSPRRKVRRRR